MRLLSNDKMSWSLRIGGILCLLAVFFPAEISAANRSPLQQVKVQLKWIHQFQFAGYYAALYKGYYRKRGLEVELLEAHSGIDPMQVVVDGDADFGVGNTDLLLMRARGDKVVLLANIFQHSPVAIMVMRDQPRHNIHELARGRIMMEPNSAELLAYLKSEGMNIDSLNLVEHDFDAQKLIDGEVDAMSTYVTGNPYKLIERNLNFRLYRPVDSGIDFYGDNLFTMQKTIDENPELVKAFLEASLEGWKYAMSHRDEIVEYIASHYPQYRSRESLAYEGSEMDKLILTDIVEVGYINPLRWERIAELYLRVGFLDDAIDLKSFIYNRNPQLIPQWIINSIIVAIVIALIASLISVFLARFNARLKQEIDERLKAEYELKDSNNQKDVILSVIGHDLKSLFGSLMMFTEQLSNKTNTLDADTVSRYAGNIKDAATNAQQILENLLDWAMLRTGQRQSKPEPVNLNNLLVETVRLYQSEADKKQIVLEVEKDTNLVAHTDRYMLNTVIRNLISNAIKFTDEGGKIRLYASEKDNDVVILVSDTGTGINSEKLDRINDGEILTSNMGTKNETGVGLGLSICYQMIAAVNGTLTVKSDVGEGTTFSITLPGN